ATGLDRLVISHDGDEYVLGRPDLGIYVAVPQAGAVLVEVLQAGGSPAEATARASQVAGAEVDAQDFLDGLAAVGLWQPPAERDRPAASGRSGRRGREIRWIEGVSPQAARRLFGPVAWSCYALA